MSKIRDLTGLRSGKLEVIKFMYVANRQAWWLCKCDCGNISIVSNSNLTSGHTKSCGCWKMKVLHEKAVTHGKSKNRIYYIWSSMKQRCCNPKNQAYSNYGGRGITLCKEWFDFKGFYEGAKTSGYRDNLSLDRIDNNGNYDPSNCRWATMKEQDNNKRSNVLITYEGETKTLIQWSECKKIRFLGWTVEDALSKPSRGITKRK